MKENDPFEYLQDFFDLKENQVKMLAKIFNDQELLEIWRSSKNGPIDALSSITNWVTKQLEATRRNFKIQIIIFRKK